jgi:hypothetical protein
MYGMRRKLAHPFFVVAAADTGATKEKLRRMSIEMRKRPYPNV